MARKGLLGFYGNVENSKTRIPAIKLWKSQIIKNIKRDVSTYPKRRNYNFYSNGNATMSEKDLITYYYTIDGYPAEIPIKFKSEIRLEAGDGVKISFISTFEPTKIDWDSPQMRSKLRVWRSLDNNTENVDEYNYIDHMGTMDNTQRRKDSLLYLADADRRRRRNLFKYRTLMVIAGKRGDAFDKTIERVKEYCKNQGILITRVEEQIQDFLRAFSPFSMELGNGILSKVGSNTIPDEQLARFSGYKQGRIGKESL